MVVYASCFNIKIANNNKDKIASIFFEFPWRLDNTLRD